MNIMFNNRAVYLPVVSNMCDISGWSTWVILAIMFLCDRQTPLDRPVVPLEYGKSTRSLLDAERFKIDTSMDGSSISLKSHVPSGFGPPRLIDTTNIGFFPGSLANSFWASITFGKSSGVVTTPEAPEFLSWWAISTEIRNVEGKN